MTQEPQPRLVGTTGLPSFSVQLTPGPDSLCCCLHKLQLLCSRPVWTGAAEGWTGGCRLGEGHQQGWGSCDTGVRSTKGGGGLRVRGTSISKLLSATKRGGGSHNWTCILVMGGTLIFHDLIQKQNQTPRCIDIYNFILL